MCSVQRQLSVNKKLGDRRALPVDAKVFNLALRSYPELFLREPRSRAGWSSREASAPRIPSSDGADAAAPPAVSHIRPLSCVRMR